MHRLGNLILFRHCTAIVSIKTVPVGAGAVFVIYLILWEDIIVGEFDLLFRFFLLAVWNPNL